MEGLLPAAEDPGQPLDLSPERLRIHDEPLPRHDPDLALQGMVIDALAGGHLDGEIGRIAGSGEELHRAGRRLDAAVAGAAVLLPPLLLEHEPPLDDGYLLRLLELAGKLARGLPHFGQPRSASSMAKSSSATGSAGWARGPWPIWGAFSGASRFSTGRFSYDFPKRSLFFTASCASNWERRS